MSFDYKSYMRKYNASPRSKLMKREWMRRRRKFGLRHCLRWNQIVEKFLVRP